MKHLEYAFIHSLMESQRPKTEYRPSYEYYQTYRSLCE